MKYLRCMLLFVVLLLCGCTGKEAGLSGYAGRDLQGLREEEREAFDQQFKGLTQKAKSGTAISAMFPVVVTKTRRSAAQWMVVRAYPGINVPDVSFLSFHWFDGDWRFERELIVPTGYRSYIKSVGFSRRQDGIDIVTVFVTSTGPFLRLDDGSETPLFAPKDGTRQVYAIIGERVALIRLETGAGVIERNSYAWRKPSNGLAVVDARVERVIGVLENGSSADQLEMLVWLTGYHLPSTQERLKNHNQESVEDSLIVERVRMAAETKRALEKLTGAQDPWVADYARLALKLMEENRGSGMWDQE